MISLSEGKGPIEDQLLVNLPCAVRRWDWQNTTTHFHLPQSQQCPCIVTMDLGMHRSSFAPYLLCDEYLTSFCSWEVVKMTWKHWRQTDTGSWMLEFACLRKSGRFQSQQEQVPGSSSEVDGPTQGADLAIHMKLCRFVHGYCVERWTVYLYYPPLSCALHQKNISISSMIQTIWLYHIL
jgi:hypothetical protein